jgi:hypothetical protein
VNITPPILRKFFDQEHRNVHALLRDGYPGMLPPMGKKTKAAKTPKKSAGKHAVCGAELVTGATFCWHCKRPFKVAKAAKKKK